MVRFVDWPGLEIRLAYEGIRGSMGPIGEPEPTKRAEIIKPAGVSPGTTGTACFSDIGQKEVTLNVPLAQSRDISRRTRTRTPETTTLLPARPRSESQLTARAQ